MTGQKILVIGAGELGYQVLRFLVAHPRMKGTVSSLLRPSSISSTSPSKQKEIENLRKLGIQLVPGDILQDSETELASVFALFDTVIGCTGFVSGPNTQIKLTQAVLKAGVTRFIPWQFGVDYDLIGRGSPQDLFDEQLDVRDLLRSQSKTSWLIISTGMFTSFLFEPSFGVVDLKNDTVQALGDWENRVTVTTPEDIGKMTAEMVLGEEFYGAFPCKPIFIGGDTITYNEVAQLVEKVVGRQMKRTVMSVEETQARLSKDPENGLIKYWGVFGQGRGVAWDLSETWNQQRGMNAVTAEEWARQNLR
ncbi:isoflavone reductase family protein [Penicillium angulare]|uniref:Isoflavone reductase family protein n=1 Tax=Penicillium angulare TaxID=116970 RepID=A0A9W9FZW2_9EURO|nr:isoflavone reductase family protein [Penicillium angulare]